MTATANDFAQDTAEGVGTDTLRSREEEPGYEGWQNFVASDDTRFPGNIGMLNGSKSNDTVDLDLDCPEAMVLAPDILPPTDAIFGRTSKPQSHLIYQCDPVPETKQYQFKKEGMIVELRSDGTQTMMPPSVHPSGEVVTWANGGIGVPAKVDGEELARCVGDLAGLSLLLRNWPEPNGRYNVEGALIGALLRAGRSVDEVEPLIAILQKHGGAARQHKPEKSVPRLADMLSKGRPVPGLRRLGELLGDEIAGKVAEWMRLQRRDAHSSYEKRDDGIYRMVTNKDGVIIPVRLCNFTAAISEVVTRDDGSGIADRRFTITGSPGRCEVPAKDFDQMAWVTTEWGPWASVAPGQAAHAAAAIKYFSEEAEERVVYTHTGWRLVDGSWVYLHGGGAIGANGPVDGIAIELEGNLAHIKLPPVRDLRAAVRVAIRCSTSTR